MVTISQIGLGGGCHWCTEAVFQSLRGVEKVAQGFVASTGEHANFSEAILVHFNTELVSLPTLIEIHLHTHKSTSNHSMRAKYRSAIYTFTETQHDSAVFHLEGFQKDFDQGLVTKILPFSEFKTSRDALQNYYGKNPKKPFCETYINPKLKLLLHQFSAHAHPEKLNHLRKDDKSTTAHSK